jgi:hypothetical protein
MYRERIAFAAALFSLVLLGSCEPPMEGPTAISVENGPAFTFHGQAELARFTVFAPVNGTKIANPFDPSSPGWKIEGPRPHVFGSGIGIGGLRLVYGEIPRAYTQTVPNVSRTTPKLFPGRIYSFEGCSTLSGCLSGDFYVDKTGGAEAVDIPTCWASTGHVVIRIDCETHKPFPEPADVEKYARQHRRVSAFTPGAIVTPAAECEPEKAK